MRYGIFSDVHSNLEALEAVLGAYKNESIDKYLCAGDIVGYAANPRECVNRIKEITSFTVAGNHDWATVNLFSTDYFNSIAREAVFWTRQNLDDDGRCFLESLELEYENDDLTVVHGTLNNPQEFNYMLDGYSAEESFSVLKRRICFLGHTHVAGFFIKEDNNRITYRQDYTIKINEGFGYVVNVGSVGQPRDGNPEAAYCIYDTDKKEVLIKRIKYDTFSARKKIIDVGLPQFLGDRLLMGK